MAATKTKTRKLKTSPYRSFRLGKRVKNQAKPLPSAWKIFKQSLQILRQNWRLFAGILAVYLVLSVIIVQGLQLDTGLGEAKESLKDVFTGNTGSILTALTLFGYLVDTSGTPASEAASVYQSVILIVMSLALIWALRQLHSKQKLNTREAFYHGMYPLVPFLLVLCVIGLQLLPLLIGSWLYGVTITGGIAVTAAEQALWLILVGLLALLSLYMVSSSVFAAYISTLPDMTPMKALRSARELVRHRRFLVIRKILFLPLILLLLGALIMVPLIILVTPVAPWIFLILSTMVLAVVHSYIYSLYRELL